MKTKLERMFSLYDRLQKRHYEYSERCAAKAKQILLDAGITSVNTGYITYDNRREIFAISPRTGYVFQTSHLETIDYDNEEMAEEIRNLLCCSYSGKSLFLSQLKEEIEWKVFMLTNEEPYASRKHFFLNINDITYSFEVRHNYGREISLVENVPTVIIAGEQIDFENF